MKTKGKTAALGLATIAAMASSHASATDSGWYLGGNLGLAKASVDDERIIDGLLAGGFTAASLKDDDSDLGYKLFGGYQFNRYLALEGGYFNLGEFGFKADTVPAGTLGGNIKLQGFNLDGLVHVPLSDRFSAFGRLGANYAQAKDKFTDSGAVHVLDPKRSKKDLNYKFGLGLEYDFSSALSLRLEGERYRIDDAVGNKGDIDLASLGLVYRFGTAEATPPLAVVAPPPVVAAPPPPPPPPAPTRVSFEASSLFDFESAGLKPEGRQALDAFAAKLAGTRYELIHVTGHTDRLGGHAYNMDLSRQRAEAVKHYLVESGRIPADKISAEGKNGSDPVTAPGQCAGTKATPELIACLQPDRRVDVEVTGNQ